MKTILELRTRILQNHLVRNLDVCQSIKKTFTKFPIIFNSQTTTLRVHKKYCMCQSRPIPRLEQYHLAYLHECWWHPSETSQKRELVSLLHFLFQFFKLCPLFLSSQISYFCYNRIPIVCFYSFLFELLMPFSREVKYDSSRKSRWGVLLRSHYRRNRWNWIIS